MGLLLNLDLSPQPSCLAKQGAARTPEQCVGTVCPVLGYSRGSLDGPAVAPVGSVVISRLEGLAAFLVVLLSNTAAAAAAAAGHGKRQVVVTPLAPPAGSAEYRKCSYRSEFQDV
jgi:hypothetical protein